MHPINMKMIFLVGQRRFQQRNHGHVQQEEVRAGLSKTH